MEPNKDIFTRLELAEERTALSFIRTVAIFAGIYVVLHKTIKNKLIPKLVIITINILLIYRIFNLKYTSHKLYIQIFAACLIICLTIIAFADNL